MFPPRLTEGNIANEDTLALVWCHLGWSIDVYDRNSGLGCSEVVDERVSIPWIKTMYWHK